MPNSFTGHPVLAPDGAELCVPASVFPRLRVMGLLQRGPIPRIADRIYQYMLPEYDCLTDGLRFLLGPDVSGPAWCECHCTHCKRKLSDLDQTATPRPLVPAPHAVAAA